MARGAENLNWIDTLPETARMAVLAAMKTVRARPGEMLYERNAPVKGLYRILDGHVRLYSLSPDGRELLYKVFGRQESFGDIAAIDGEPYPLFAEALDECELQFLSREALTKLRADYREVETALLDYAVRIARTTVLFIEEAAIFSLTSRIASRLVFLAASARARCEPVDKLKVAQKDIGVMVGASRQATNKVLAELQAKGLVETHYGAIRILDLQGLKDTAARITAAPKAN